jgi:hypothetical protein
MTDFRVSRFVIGFLVVSFGLLAIAINTFSAPTAITVGTVYSSTQTSSQSFLRFYNSGVTDGKVTIALRDFATGQSLGQWTSPNIPAGSEQQYSIATIENGTGQSFTKPAYYSINVQTNITGYFQHVLYRPADGTLTNLSTCAAGTTADPAKLSAVHSSLLDSGFPSSVAVNNTGTTGASATLGIYDANTGTKLGTYTTASIPANGQLILATKTIETSIGRTPTSVMYHYVIKQEGTFTGFLQHLVTNKQAGVITDMTTACALDGGASTTASSPLIVGTVYSSTQQSIQSFLRFYNTGTNDGKVTVTLRDYSNGTLLAQWTSPNVPAGSEQQYSVATIESETGQSFTKPAFYAISVQSSIVGHFQHVLYRPADGTLTNLSTCAAGTTADPAKLSAVHSSLLDSGFPSSVAVNNTGTTGASATLGIYDANTGTKLGTYTTASIPANGQLILATKTIETSIGRTPTSVMYHYVIKQEGTFTGFLQHLVTNKQAGVITDMTTTCAVSNAAQAFRVRAFNINVFNNYSGGTGQNSTTLNTYDVNNMTAVFQDYKDIGFNTVSIAWQVAVNEVTGGVSPTFNNQPKGHVATLTEVRQIAAIAKSLNLDVILKPIPVTLNPAAANGNNPGNINDYFVPAANFNVEGFLDNWAVYMSPVGQLAQEIGATMVAVGTEQGGFDTAPYRDRWIAIINAVRANYTGIITYNSFDYPSRVSFWDKVDVIGIDAYYALTSKTSPVYADVLAGWTNNSASYEKLSPNGTPSPFNIVSELQKLAAKYSKPLYFSEFGGKAFRGVVNDPAGGGPTEQVKDYQQHSWLFQSMFQSMNQANATKWFQGVAFWAYNASDVAKSDPYFEQFLTDYGTGFDIRGKTAEMVFRSWFGEGNYLGSLDSSFTGSIADDKIYLYGNNVSSAATITAGAQISQPMTYNSKVSLKIDGNILNGNAGTVRVYINGQDKGSATLDATPGSYVDPQGVKFTREQVFDFTLPGLINVTELRIVLENPVTTGSSQTQVNLKSVSINGVTLTNATYTRPNGTTQQQTFNQFVGASGGGFFTIDPAPWNSALTARTIGTASQPIQINGGEGGTDSAYVLGSRSDYTVSGIGTSTVRLIETRGLNQNATLTGVKFVVFQNGLTLNTSNGSEF